MKKRSLTVSEAAKRAKKIRYRHASYYWSGSPERLAHVIPIVASVDLGSVVRGDICARGLREDKCRIDDGREEWCGYCRRVEILPDDFEPRMEAGAEIVPTVAVEFEHRNPQRPASPEQVAEMFVSGMPSECRRIAAGLSPMDWMILTSLPYHQLRPGERSWFALN